MTALVDQLITSTRNQERDKWLQRYSIRNPGADITPGSLPYIRASVYADAVVPLYANAKTIANAVSLSGMSTEDLTTYGTREGIPTPAGKPASGSFGFVTVLASTGGARVVGDDALGKGKGLELKTDSGLRITVQVSGTVSQGQMLAVGSVDTGTSVNLPAGTKLTVTNPPLGLQPTLYVAADTKGNGLTGGRAAETDTERVQRFEDFNVSPPGAGNDAAYQAFVEAIVGLAVQKCFTIPAIDGAGTTGIAFTMQPATGVSRAPNNAELATVASQVAGNFPADDGQFVLALASVPVALALGARWNKTAAPWTDSTPWPQPYAGAMPFVSATTRYPPSYAFCTVAYTNASAGAGGPVAGQTIGFFDPVSQTFKAKRILSVTPIIPGSPYLGPGEAIAWVLNFDTTASDPSFVPVVGQLVSPWSNSLSVLAPPVVSYFQNTGPGEVFGAVLDAGQRRIRQPEPPLWPSAVDTPLLAPLLELPQVSSVTVISPSLPFVCPVGTPPVYANLFELGDLAAYPI